MGSEEESSSPSRPKLARRQTAPDLRPLSPDEESNVESSRTLVKQISKTLSCSADFGAKSRVVLDVGENGVTTTRVWTKRSKRKALSRTVDALSTGMPLQRTPSLQRELVHVVEVLASSTDNPEMKQSLHEVVENGVIGLTLTQAIDEALDNGECLALLRFDKSAWRPDHFQRLLFREETGTLRKRAFTFSRLLLRAWLGCQAGELCLREDGPAPLLLKALLSHLDLWQPNFLIDPSQDAEVQSWRLFQGACQDVTKLPKKLRKLLRFIVGWTNMQPATMLSFLLLRHYLPAALAAGFVPASSKKVLALCSSPPQPNSTHALAIAKLSQTSLLPLHSPQLLKLQPTSQTGQQEEGEEGGEREGEEGGEEAIPQ